MLKLALTVLGTCALFTVLPAFAGSIGESISSRGIEPLGATNRNRIGASFRMGLNLRADFKQIGGFGTLNPINNPLRTPNGDRYNYDNGYIYPDDTTANAHPGATWYYGYVAGTPLQPEDAPTDFQLSRTSSRANRISRDNDGDPQLGMELTYNRQLGRLGRGFWGLEAALGFTDISIQDSRTLQATAVQTVDTFRTLGFVLKPAPFAGTSEGPAPNDANGWPLVSLSPVATSTGTFAGAATVRGHREFDAKVLSLRVGPYCEVPLSERWTFALSGGLALLEINSDFSYNETVTIAGSATLVPLTGETHRGAGSKSDLLVGGYVGGSFSYALNERWRLFAGAQFQSSGDYSQTEAGKSAVLHLDQSVFVSLGGTFSF